MKKPKTKKYIKKDLSRLNIDLDDEFDTDDDLDSKDESKHKQKHGLKHESKHGLKHESKPKYEPVSQSKSETKSDSEPNFISDLDTDSEQRTILDEYIKRNKQFIVLVLGLPCSNKSELAKELMVDLKLPIININDYLIENKFIDKEVDGVKFKLYEHPDNYNWEKINLNVNSLKKRGVILYGNYLDIDKIDWIPDTTYFISLGYSNCRKKLIEKKLLPYPENDQRVQLYFNKIFNPIYEELKTKVKINKFFNVKEDTTFNQIYDELFDGLMIMIGSRLKNNNFVLKPNHKNSNHKK